MSKNAATTEVELKLAVDAASLPALRRRLAGWGPGRASRLDSVYFDTDDLQLAQHGAALRLRRSGRRWVQTLKTGDDGAALSRRGEWEVPAPGGRLALDRFDAGALPAWLRQIDPSTLAPRFRTRFERTVWDVDTAGARIEVALDIGEIVAGQGEAVRRVPLCEVELELKSHPQRPHGRDRRQPGGRRAAGTRALFDTALRLQGGPGTRRVALALLPLGQSKAARAVRLVSGGASVPVKAGAKGFTRRITARVRCGQALRSVIAHGTDVLLANSHGALVSDDPEFVHQARVALRRMRSAIRLLRRQVEFPAALLAEMRWIAGVLGEARDWDVLVCETLPALLGDAPATVAVAAADMLGNADSTRQSARARMRAALCTARFAALALRLARWGAGEDGAEGPRLREIAARRIERATRRLLREARDFAALDAQRRHRVRILAKRLRYGLELLAPALPKRTTGRWLAQLEPLQEELGRLNDAAVALQAVRQLPAPRELLDYSDRRAGQIGRAATERAQALLQRLAASPWPD
jgi:inorganic triphosphatase YgiF